MDETKLARRYLTWALPAVATYLVSASLHELPPIVAPALTASGVAAIGIAIRRQPTLRRHWRLFFAAGIIFVGADVLHLVGPAVGIPGLEHLPATSTLLVYLPAYVLITLGLVSWVRHDRRPMDRGMVLDVTIVTVGLGLVVWNLVLGPIVAETPEALRRTPIVPLFAAVDLALFATAARVALTGGLRSSTDRLVVGFVGSLLIADVAWSQEFLTGMFTASSPLLAGYSAAWVLLGTGALLDHRNVDRGRLMRPRLRPQIMAAAVLVPLCLIVWEGGAGDVDVTVLGIGTAVLFVLVLSRMRDLNSGLEEQRALAERLLRTETQYRELLDHIPAVPYVDIFTPSGGQEPVNMMHVGPQVAELFGVTQEEWLASRTDPWFDLLHPDDRERVLAEGRRVSQSRETYFRAEYRMRHRDGHVRWIREEASIERQPDGGETWRGVMYDSSDRHEAEEALREAEERYRSLVELLPVAVYSEVRDASGTTYFTSPQFERMLGLEPGEGGQVHWLDLVHLDDRSRMESLEARTRATGEPFRAEYRMRHAEGRWIWVRDEADLVEASEDGTHHVWNGVLADVTERHLAQQQLERSYRELRKLHRERAILVAKVAAAQETERSNIAEAIHDDPLQQMTAVGMRLAAFRKFLSDETALESLGELEVSVATSIQRLRRLLFELRPRTLDTGGLVSALDAYAKEMADEAGGSTRFRVESELTEEPPAATRSVAYRIALEAMRNARKHSGASLVTVKLLHQDGGVLTTVADDGVGAAPKDLVDRPGHLGISSMRERAQMNGGWFRLETEPHGGTTVSFWLPDDSGLEGERRPRQAAFSASIAPGTH